MHRPKQIIDKFQTHVTDDVSSDGEGGNHDDQDDDDDDKSEDDDDDNDDDDGGVDDDDIKWRKESDSCRSGTITQLNLKIETKFTSYNLLRLIHSERRNQ